jgi:hypothetical protein
VQEVGNIPGISTVWKRLKQSNIQARGTRYELEAAAAMKRSGENVKKLNEDVKIVSAGTVARTDVDIVTELANGLEVYHQVKRSKRAFRSLKEVKMWVSKALAKTGTSDSGRVKYIVPSLDVVPRDVLDYPAKFAPPVIIEVVPHLP